MNYLEFAKKINLSKEAISVINNVDLTPKEVCRYYKIFKNDFDLFCAEIDKKENKYQLYLALYCNFAVFSYCEYQAKKIPDEIFYDTFSDFKVWNENCIIETGVNGLKEVDWLNCTLNLGIFKLGRLQFQPEILAEPLILKDIIINKGETIYNVHIQAGDKLTMNSVIQSFNKAKQFFNETELILFCESWMLSPVLNDLLDSCSNIMQFKNLFNVFETDYNSRSIERYLFGKQLDNYNDYQANSSLSKKVIKLLKQGKNVGVAKGYYILK